MNYSQPGKGSFYEIRENFIQWFRTNNNRIKGQTAAAKYTVPIRVERIKVLFKQSKGILGGNYLVSALTVFVLWDSVAHDKLTIWLISIYVLTSARIWMTFAFHKSTSSDEDIQRWGVYFSISSFLSGVTWGLLYPWALVITDVFLVVSLSTILIGMTAAALPSLTSYYPAYYSFAIPNMIPMALTNMIIGGVIFGTLGILVLIYLIVMIMFGYVNHKVLLRSIELRYINLDLLNQLQNEKDKVERALDESQTANAVKTQFLAAASHDLRQPLHSLGMFVSALDERVEKGELRQITDHIKLSTQALSGLLNSLLDISKLDAGMLQPVITDLNLKQEFKTIQNEFLSMAVKKGLRLRFDSSQYWVSSDREILLRILRNLVTNAVRYTDKGTITVSASLEDDHIRISVKDTGSGIPEDKQGEIFREFKQLHNPERDREKGLGLGLAIVKRLSDLMEYKLELTSSIGRGSVFSVLVPKTEAVAQNTDVPGNISVPFDGLSVAVIDDEKSVRDAMSILLTGWGCLTYVFGSEAEALSGLERAPSIIIADYRLRDNKTGAEAIIAISRKFPQAKIPAMIVTGDTDPARLIEARSSGYLLINKPVSGGKLRSALNRLAGKLVL